MKARSERRQSPRFPGRFPVRYRLIPVRQAGYLDGRAEDLSRDGLRFRCRDGMRPRAGLLIEMLIPGAPPVRLFGRATWVRELPGRAGFEVGGSFVDQSTAARITIERHLQGDHPGPGR